MVCFSSAISAASASICSCSRAFRCAFMCSTTSVRMAAKTTVRAISTISQLSFMKSVKDTFRLTCI